MTERQGVQQADVSSDSAEPVMTQQVAKTTLDFPQARCRTGVARVDITPPAGIYHRMWGAARHDRATGIHRPLTATILTMRPVDESGPGLTLIAMDHCLLWSQEMSAFLEAVSRQAGIDRDSIVTFFSHTHAAGLMGLERTGLPGGDMIPAYLEELATRTAAAVSQAGSAETTCLLSFGTGRCDLAQNRDYFDEQAGHYVCGFNPDGQADDSVIVAKVVDEASGRTTATIVNYACHPTTLAWDNTLISPDYVGSMREVVETATNAPCLFIQGASGDIGPRDGFVGDVEIADRNGRQLGYAAASTLERLVVATRKRGDSSGIDAVKMSYTGAVLSGATIGTWQTQAVDESRAAALTCWRFREATVELPFRQDLVTREQLEQEQRRWQAVEQSAAEAGDADQAADARAMVERMTRRLVRVRDLPAGRTYSFQFRVWRFGDVVWVVMEGEHYNVLQRRIRATFPGVEIVVASLANGSACWYLPDEQAYGKGLYQEEASVLAQGSLETLISAIIEQITGILEDGTGLPVAESSGD